MNLSEKCPMILDIGLRYRGVFGSQLGIIHYTDNLPKIRQQHADNMPTTRRYRLPFCLKHKENKHFNHTVKLSSLFNMISLNILGGYLSVRCTVWPDVGPDIGVPPIKSKLFDFIGGGPNWPLSAPMSDPGFPTNFVGARYRVPMVPDADIGSYSV